MESEKCDWSNDVEAIVEAMNALKKCNTNSPVIIEDPRGVQRYVFCAKRSGAVVTFGDDGDRMLAAFEARVLMNGASLVVLMVNGTPHELKCASLVIKKENSWCLLQTSTPT